MRQLIIDGLDKRIPISLTSNTILPGSYINAQYNLPDDDRVSQLDSIVEAVTNVRINPIVASATIGKEYNKTAVFKAFADSKRISIAPQQALTMRVEINEPVVEPIKVVVQVPGVVSTYEDVVEHFKPGVGKYFITGTTESKFTIIERFFKKEVEINFSEQRLNLVKKVGSTDGKSLTVANSVNNTFIRARKKLVIPGLNIATMIVNESLEGKHEYVYYLDTENPIKYIDLGNGMTRFIYLRRDDIVAPTANLIQFEGLMEEPKIYSEVFIDRGLNSAFEKVKKLKNIKDINELKKTGLGYYKINYKGFNFKNL